MSLPLHQLSCVTNTANDGESWEHYAELQSTFSDTSHGHCQQSAIGLGRSIIDIRCHVSVRSYMHCASSHVQCPQSTTGLNGRIIGRRSQVAVLVYMHCALCNHYHIS